MLDLERTDGPGGWRLVEGDGEAWEVDLKICDSALCGCREVRVGLWFAQEPGAALVRGWARLDPVARCLAERHPGMEPASPPEVGRLLAEGLSEAAWERLGSVFLREKQEQVEAFDPAGEVWEFDFEEIEEEGVLVPFVEVFPLARWLRVELGGQELVVHDEYCLAGRCRCSNVDLELFRPEDVEDQEAPPVGWLLVDARTGRRMVSVDRDRRLGPELRGWRGLRRSHPELLPALRRRREVLHTLYRNSWAAKEGVPATPARKVGRNEPCPCGSGKKYKRCCGRRGV